MVHSFANFGYDGSLVTVEVDLRKGIPAVDIVGFSDGAVAEARERVRAAIANSGFEFPSERVLISLSPAGLKKDGAGFNLAIALAILDQSESVSKDVPVLVMGELGLSGDIIPVRGLWAAVSTAKSAGIVHAIVPNTDEELPEGMITHRVDSLQQAFEVYSHITGDEQVPEAEEKPFKVEFPDIDEDEGSLDEIKGMDGLKYAMAVAVAGGHNIMAWGKPGCGKSMVLQRMPQLLPKLTAEEKPSVSRIWSLAGMGGYPKDGSRPFRMPHQTASIEGMCGGGVNLRPGEISLAHNGVLFLDEAAEFRSAVLQMLRVPLDNGVISLCRAGRSSIFPAHFRLAMASNSCPCGNFGSKDKVCLCSAKSITQYWNKFSAPLIDRIAICFDCNQKDTTRFYTVEQLRAMIKKAWENQYARQGKLNQDMGIMDFKEAVTRYLDIIPKELSVKSAENIVKVARTIADMDGRKNIAESDIQLALQLHARTPLENL